MRVAVAGGHRRQQNRQHDAACHRIPLFDGMQGFALIIPKRLPPLIS
jgi:hypothetical protein